MRTARVLNFILVIILCCFCFPLASFLSTPTYAFFNGMTCNSSQPDPSADEDLVSGDSVATLSNFADANCDGFSNFRTDTSFVSGDFPFYVYLNSNNDGDPLYVNNFGLDFTSGYSDVIVDGQSYTSGDNIFIGSSRTVSVVYTYQGSRLQFDTFIDVVNHTIGGFTVSEIMDSDAPIVTISGVPTVTEGSAFTATFTFNEDVIGFDLSDVTAGLENATASEFTALSSTEYTALITPDGNGDVIVSLAADAVQDTALNGNGAATSHAAVLDTDAPTITISGAPSTTTGTPFTVTFTFSEDVNGFEEADIILSAGTLSEFTTVDAKTYTALITPPADSTGTITINIAADSAQDNAGNGNEAAQQVMSPFDTIPLTITLGEIAPNDAGAYQMQIDINKTGTGFSVDDLSVTNATVDNLEGPFPVNATASIAVETQSAVANTTNGEFFIATLSPTTGDAIEVTVAAGEFTDASGNSNEESNTSTVIPDQVAPSLTSVTPSVAEIGDDTSTFSLTLVFSEDMDTSVTPAITLSSSDGDPSQTLTISTGSFSDARTFVQSYSVADQNQNLSAVDVAVSGGQDGAGNSLVAFSADAVFSIVMDLDIISEQLQNSGARLLAQSAHRGARYSRNVVQQRFRNRVTAAHNGVGGGSAIGFSQGTGGGFYVGSNGKSLVFDAQFAHQKLGIPLLNYDKAASGGAQIDGLDIELLQQLGITVYATGSYETGEDLDSYYLSAGIDKSFGLNTVFGLLATYEDHDFEELAQHNLGLVNADKDGLSITLYGSHIVTELLSFQGAISYGRFDTSITLGDHVGNFDSDRWNGFIQATINKQFGRIDSFTSIGVQGVYEDTDGYVTNLGAVVDEDKLREWDIYLDQNFIFTGLNVGRFRFDPYVGGTLSLTHQSLASQSEDDTFLDVDLKLGFTGEFLLGDENSLGYLLEVAGNDLSEEPSFAVRAGLWGNILTTHDRKVLKYRLDAFNTIDQNNDPNLGAKLGLQMDF